MKTKRKVEVESLGRSQYDIWEIQKEIEAYASLFINCENGSEDTAKLYGLGLAFERMAQKLDKVWIEIDIKVLEIAKTMPYKRKK
jgi:hypothetical protein